MSIPYYKERSIKGCIVDAWRIFAHSPRRFLRFLAFPLLAGGISLAVGFTCLLQLNEKAFLFDTLLQAMGKAAFRPLFATMFGGQEAAFLLAFLLLTILGRYFIKGALFVQIRLYRNTDELPAVSGLLLRKEIFKEGLRLLEIDTLLFLLLLLVGGVVAAAAYYLTPWLGLLGVPVAIVWGLFALAAELNYVLERLPLREALVQAGTRNFRIWGGYFVILLLTFLPAGVLIFTAQLPTTVLALSHRADVIGRLTGEAPALPSYFLPLYFGSLLLTTLTAALVASLQLWPLALKLAATRVGKLRKDNETEKNSEKTTP